MTNVVYPAWVLTAGERRAFDAGLAAVSPVPPDGEPPANPYARLRNRPPEPSAAVAWNEGFAAGRAAATPDPPAGLPKDEKCPTCGLTRWEGKQIDGWLKAVPMAVSSPDERLREAAEALVVAAARAVCEPGPFRDNDDHLQWKLADAITATRSALAAADREAPKAALDAVYAERNAVVLGLAKAGLMLGWRVGRASDPNEPDWPVIYIDTPAGQVSWHFRAADVPDWVEPYPGEWDRHSDREKYERLSRLPVLPAASPDERLREATTARPRRSATITADEWAESLPVPLPIDAPKPSRNVRWGARADDPPTEIHNDPEKTRAYLAGLAAGRSEKLVTTDHPGRPDGTLGACSAAQRRSDE